MRFYTFLKSGIEVLHLGMQHSTSAAWPIEHWRANPGRWRLFTPGIDRYMNEGLVEKTFGTSIDSFVLLLEVADFASWGAGPAFSGPEGRTTYSPKARELRSVGQLDWTQVQMLTAKQQLQAYSAALVSAIRRVSESKRKPKDFDAEAFAQEVASWLKSAKVSRLSRAFTIQRSE